MKVNLGRNILLCFAAMLMGNMATSCKDGDGLFTPEEDNIPVKGLILSTLPSGTRADDEHFDGKDDPFGEPSTKEEEAIKKAELYFFETSTDENATFYHTTINDIDKITRAEITIKLPMTKVDKFKQRDGSDEKTAYVYALVNLPEGTTLPTDEEATLSKLMEIQVSNPGFTSGGTPASFVMRGGNTVRLEGEDRDAKITGWIPIERLAAKVRMFCKIHPRVYLDENGKTIYRLVDENGEYKETEAEWKERAAKNAHEVWEARPEVSQGENAGQNNTFLYFYNFTTNAKMNGTTGSGNSENFQRYDWLTYDNIDRTQEKEKLRRVMGRNVNVADYTESAGGKIVKRDDYPYTHSVPYYSYPNSWNSSSLEEEHATNVMLRLQWECVYDKDYDGGTYQEGQTIDDPVNRRFEYFYYQIPVNRLPLKDQKPAHDCINSNTYYRILIDIAMLGAKDLGTPLPIDASWEAIPWGYAGVDVNIKERRYLVVNQTHWTMNNVHTIQIPFSTSHETVIDYCYVTYFRYYDPWGTDPNSKEPDTYDSYTNKITSYKEPPTHNNKEFENWLSAAESQLRNKGGKDGEGPITADFDGKRGDSLYYKKKYFYDDVKYFDYKYYVGKEQPKTVKQSVGKYNKDVMPPEVIAKWDLYNKKYDRINAIYTYKINNELGVIDLVHPLVLWNEVRDENGYIKYYEPELNTKGNLKDEYSRCEIVIKIRHKDRPKDEGLFEETIYITQYPAIYVEVSHNYGSPATFDDEGINFNSTTNYATSHGNEYVLVNGNSIENLTSYQNTSFANSASYSTEWFEAGRWVEYFGTINNNPNMYVIHTSQFSEDNEYQYTIGDPRTLYYNNLLTNESFNRTSNTTRRDGTPDRWSDEDPTPTGASRTIFTHIIQEKENRKGPAWFTVRYWQSLTGNYYYDYQDYKLCQSMYKEQKPNNSADDPPTRSNQWNNYVNHKNNLCYYYPTDESSGVGSKENFIAPEFRIASSFGKVTLTAGVKSEARQRCATYQEGGRPAGRWRVPTMAEVKYLIQLSNERKIPILFGYPSATDAYGNVAYYWTAAGSIGVRVRKDGNDYTTEILDGNESVTPAVRCVYDEWYWKKEDGSPDLAPGGDLETEFWWGDKLKDNPQTN